MFFYLLEHVKMNFAKDKSTCAGRGLKIISDGLDTREKRG